MDNCSLPQPMAEELDGIMQDSIKQIGQKNKRDITVILSLGKNAMHLIREEIDDEAQKIQEWLEIINDCCDLADESFGRSLQLIGSNNDFDKFWFWATINSLCESLRYLEFATSEFEEFLQNSEFNNLSHLHRVVPDVETWLDHQQKIEMTLKEFSE